ncbi:tetraacyldisaccharide 4'-kinase [Pseudomonadota bacterium]
MNRLDSYWNNYNAVAIVLWPISLVFHLLAWMRRCAYRIGLFKQHKLPVPVIVVGNISVGGTGKTPLVIWLAEHLKALGYTPGIVARGYGAKIGKTPREVTPESCAEEVGDEPLLISRRTGCPMFVAPNRVAAARALLEKSDCNVIISDDGMQHYALGRDIEIAVVDGSRRFGNGCCLPAGPLREPVSRLATVDLVIVNGESASGEHSMQAAIGKVVNLRNPELTHNLEDFSGEQVHALAGIGNPQRFFQLLKEYDLQSIEWAFPDHHQFEKADITPDDELPVFMTEKDAVKCSHFAQPRHWYLPIDVNVDSAFSNRLAELLRGLKRG